MTEPAWQVLSTGLQARFQRWGARPEVAADLRQETLLRVQRGLEGLEDPSRLGPWVSRIARNVWVDHLRARRPEDALPEEGEPVPADLQAPVVSLQDPEAMVASWLPLLIESLEEPYRTALKRVDLEGWSQQRLAAELGLSASGARSRVQRGRKLLRTALEACCAVAWEGGAVVDWRPQEEACRC